MAEAKPAKPAKPDYAADVQKYTENVDAAALAGIVKHLGIALRSKDSSLVAASDPEEMKRLRDGFLKKKLGLKETPDKELDALLKDVAKRMARVREKSRVTFCYLLAEKCGKLDTFVKKAS